MRIGLLQLVEGAVDDELTKFLDARLDLEMAGERDALVFGLEAKEQVADLCRVDRLARPRRGFQGIEEGLLEHRPHRKQPGTPLPSGIDALESAVVELEAEVERQLQIVVG